MAVAEEVDRTTFLGGSDISALYGLNPYMNIVDLWQYKTKQKVPPPDTVLQYRRKQRGRKLEPFVVDMGVDKLREQGHDVKIVCANQRYADPRHSFFSCEIDFELMLDGEHVNGDCKTVGYQHAGTGWGVEGTDEIPAGHAAQFYWGQGITKRGKTVVFALRGLDDVKIYMLEAHQPTIEAVRRDALTFWKDNVVGGATPVIKTYEEALAAWAYDDSQDIAASEGVLEAVTALRTARLAKKVAEANEEAAQLTIATYMGTRSKLMTPAGLVLSWKTQEARRIDVERLRTEEPAIAAKFTKASISRVMRLHKTKEQS
jgi:predicted phage-related endonuclease